MNAMWQDVHTAAIDAIRDVSERMIRFLQELQVEAQVAFEHPEEEGVDLEMYARAVVAEVSHIHIMTLRVYRLFQSRWRFWMAGLAVASLAATLPCMILAWVLLTLTRLWVRIALGVLRYSGRRDSTLHVVMGTSTFALITAFVML